jgi:predicted O-methyltransferase YrrM
MLLDGLPPSLVGPFLFLLHGQLDAEDVTVVRKIEMLRSALAQRKHECVTIFYDKMSETRHSKPSASDGKVADVSMRSLVEIAHVSSVLPHWGIFLWLCANAIRAKSILELGSSAGISGCYLASGKYCQRFVTVEGSAALAQLAEIHLRQVSKAFQVINATFKEGLDQILPTFTEGIDMVYIDGGKNKSANLYWFDRVMPYLNPGSVVVLDDIHWSSEMQETWDTVRRHEGFLHTISAGRFGVCVWAGGRNRPKTDTLYKMMGVDLYQLKVVLERNGLAMFGQVPNTRQTLSDMDET